METAYVCRECGEAFIPEGDWPELRAMHKQDCPDATFKKVSVEEAF